MILSAGIFTLSHHDSLLEMQTLALAITIFFFFSIGFCFFLGLDYFEHLSIAVFSILVLFVIFLKIYMPKIQVIECF